MTHHYRLLGTGKNFLHRSLQVINYFLNCNFSFMRINYCICVKCLCSSKELTHVRPKTWWWPKVPVLWSKCYCLCILSSKTIKKLQRHHVTSISFWNSIAFRYRYCSEWHCRSRRLLLLSGDYFIMEIIIAITSSSHFNCSVLLGCMQTLNEVCSCFCIKKPHYEDGWLHARVLCIPVIHRLYSKS